MDGPCLNGAIRWNLGEGKDALRYDPDDFTYTANLHTREHDLEDGDVCTATIFDAGDNPIGAIDFAVGDKGRPGSRREI